jgi:hypothetical protein
MTRLTTQAQSRTAVLGYLAAAAASQPVTRAAISGWLKDQGLKVGEHGLRDAIELRLTRQGKQPPKDGHPTDHDWIREILGFSATKLDLDVAVVLFPGSERMSDLLKILRSTERAIRIYRGYDRDLVAVLGYDGSRERHRLQTLLEEHEPGLRWIVIRDIDDSPAAATWLSLARHAAAGEGLLAQHP